MVIYLGIAFGIGCCTVISRLINYTATEALGTWNGSLPNYIVASLLCAVAMALPLGFGTTVEAVASAPWHLYLGGAFGVIAFVISLMCLRRMNVFESTLLMLVGQLVIGIAFDLLIYQSFTLTKGAGVLLVALGIILDKKLSAKELDFS